MYKIPFYILKSILKKLNFIEACLSYDASEEQRIKARNKIKSIKNYIQSIIGDGK